MYLTTYIWEKDPPVIRHFLCCSKNIFEEKFVKMAFWYLIFLNWQYDRLSRRGTTNYHLTHLSPTTSISASIRRVSRHNNKSILVKTYSLESLKTGTVRHLLDSFAITTKLWFAHVTVTSVCLISLFFQWLCFFPMIISLAISVIVNFIVTWA